MGTPAHAAEFRRMSGIEFPLLVAPDTSLHEKAGLTRGNWVRVMAGLVRSPLTLPKYRAKLTNTDMSQLGGTFVVAPDGRVVYAQRAKTSDDNAPIDDIVTALRSARATAGASSS
jgi:peroxiredoxin